MTWLDKETMWPFSKTEEPPKSWLTPEQANVVTKIFYADHDTNCWYACALLPSREGIRLAVSSEAEAIEVARRWRGKFWPSRGERWRWKLARDIRWK